VTGYDCFVFSCKAIAIFIFNMLLLNGKIIFRRQKELKLIYLWASIALGLWLVIHFNHQKTINMWSDYDVSKAAHEIACKIEIHFNHQQSTCGVACVMYASCFQSKQHSYIHFQYVIDQWNNILHKSKRCHTHLLEFFNSIKNMTD